MISPLQEMIGAGLAPLTVQERWREVPRTTVSSVKLELSWREGGKMRWST